MAATHKDVVLAKLDSTTNEVDGIEIKSFPTIKFYKGGNNKGVDYKGGRTLADFK